MRLIEELQFELVHNIYNMSCYLLAIKNINYLNKAKQDTITLYSTTIKAHRKAINTCFINTAIDSGSRMIIYTHETNLHL